MPADLRAKVNTPLWRSAIGTRSALGIWRWIEAASPASPTLMSLLKETDPDVMLVSPTIWPKDPVEADYLHAGRALGIPTIGYVNSWDNLTSKGTVHVLPDRLHRVERTDRAGGDRDSRHPREHGPDHRRAASRHLLHAASAHDSRRSSAPTWAVPDAPYMVFLCSSRTIWEDESSMVTAMADALAREFGAAAPTLVVRPHPTNPEPFKTFSHPGVVHPPEGRRPGRLARVVAGVLRSAGSRVVRVRLEHDGVSRIGRRQSPVPDHREREVLAGAGANRAFPPSAQGRIPRDLPRRR